MKKFVAASFDGTLFVFGRKPVDLDHTTVVELNTSFFDDKNKKALTGAMMGHIAGHAKQKLWSFVSRSGGYDSAVFQGYCQKLLATLTSMCNLGGYTGDGSLPDQFIVASRSAVISVMNEKVAHISVGDLAGLFDDVGELRRLLAIFKESEINALVGSVSQVVGSHFSKVFDVAVNLTDTGADRMPSSIAKYQAKFSKHCGKQAWFLVLVILKQIEMAGGDLDDDKLLALARMLHDQVVLRPNADRVVDKIKDAASRCGLQLSATERAQIRTEVYKQLMVTQNLSQCGVFNFSGALDFLRMCADPSFVSQLKASEGLETVLVVQDREVKVRQDDWITLKGAASVVRALQQSSDRLVSVYEKLRAELCEIEGLSTTSAGKPELSIDRTRRIAIALKRVSAD